MDWLMDLLTTCIHHSELQVITASLLISTIHRSPEQPLSLFPAYCLQQLFPSNGFQKWRFFSFPCSHCYCQVNCQLPTQLQCHLFSASLAEFDSFSLSGGWSPAGSTRHGGHWLAYCTCPGWLWWRIWWNQDWSSTLRKLAPEPLCPP
jgi:hypothetical protein